MFYNTSERYGGRVEVTIEDYQKFNPGGEFIECSDNTIIEVFSDKPGDWEVIAQELTFNQFLRTKRERLGLSQQTLTDACGFAHRSEISKLEAGKLEWRLGQVIKVANLFGLATSELLAEYERQQAG